MRVSVPAQHAARGAVLKVALRVSDAMPGATSARVALRLTSAWGRTLALAPLRVVGVNKALSVPFKLSKGLRRGSYRIVARAIDSAGNRQLHARTARLTVR